MDKTFVINQLITAVLVIITTYVTVRLTTRNRNSNITNAPSKLKTVAKKYKSLVWSLFWFCLSVTLLILKLLPNSPPSRGDVFMIVILTPMAAIWLGSLIWDVWNIIRNRNAA